MRSHVKTSYSWMTPGPPTPNPLWDYRIATATHMTPGNPKYEVVGIDPTGNVTWSTVWNRLLLPWEARVAGFSASSGTGVNLPDVEISSWLHLGVLVVEQVSGAIPATLPKMTNPLDSEARWVWRRSYNVCACNDWAKTQSAVAGNEVHANWVVGQAKNRPDWGWADVSVNRTLDKNLAHLFYAEFECVTPQVVMEFSARPMFLFHNT